MFTINISFKDALTCFETLSNIKPEDERQSIESEFVKYAEKKARVGDSAAEAWLRQNTELDTSPMRFFVGMKRPEKKEKELADLESGKITSSNESSPFEESNEVITIIDLDEGDDKSEEIEHVARKLEAEPLSKKSIEKALKPLEALTGLGTVKKNLRRILEGKLIEQRREKAGLKILDTTTNHMVFTGNPGTGKTTVARLTAQIFQKLGFLSKGHLIEVTRSDLIGEYIGQTEQIVKEVLDQARGGVLFIDEAYSLHKNGANNDYGQDVITALIKFMEDARDDVIIIMAGYPDKMKYFLKSNPGLKSRIPHHLHFEDMKDDQLLHIFKDLCKENDYKLDGDAEKALSATLKDMKRLEESEFPNGRGVRNLFEEVIRRQSERLLAKNLRAKAKLKTIQAEDIPNRKISKSGNVVRLPRN